MLSNGGLRGLLFVISEIRTAILKSFVFLRTFLGGHFRKFLNASIARAQ
jgi:hypothetical protein